MASGTTCRTERRADRCRPSRLPAPTAWPIVLAFGITLVFAGLVTTASVSILGAILAASGYVGWFRDVLPHERSMNPCRCRRSAARRHQPPTRWLESDGSHTSCTGRGCRLRSIRFRRESKAAWREALPWRFSPWLYGMVSAAQHLVSDQPAGRRIFSRLDTQPRQQIAAFHWDALIIASLIHLITSLLVGLLYGAMLPMFPRRPILLGGVIAPILWSGLIHSILEFLNPVLNQRIDWLWFVVSQIGFGMVAGIVVSRQQRMRTWQHLPFAVRAGIEAPGAMPERDDEENPRR